MFEREIKFIYDFNLNKVNKLGPYFTFEQLQTVDLHPAILHYISAEIDYLVFEDRQKLLKNSVFDYSGEKISYHFNEITDELKKIKRFSLEYIAKLILHSTSFTVNFLVRPKWTLSRFIYDESKHKSSNEIKQILNYIYYYKFLKKIITSYINSKKILSMNSEEFEELLDKADKLGMEANLKGILSHSFISMAEFFNIGQMQKTRIPLTAIELFLEEKDLPNHLQKLTDTFGSDDNARFNIGDYMKVLTSVMIVQKETEPEPDQMILFDEHKEEELLNPDVDTEDSELDGKLISHAQEEQPVVELEENFEESEITPEVEKITIESEDHFEIEDEQTSELNEVEDEIESKPIDEYDENDFLKKWNTGKFSDLIDDEVKDENQNPTEDTTEIISVADEEIRIKPHTKIRIKVNEDNKIEPINEEEKIDGEKDELNPSVDLVNDELDSYSSMIINEPTEEEMEIIDEKEDIEKIFDSKFDLPDDEDIIDEPKQDSVKMFGSFEEDANDEEEIPSDLADNEEEVVTFKSVLENTEAESDQSLDERIDEQSKLDLAEVLEHKSMTKIIEVIFDYDIEDFANLLDEISECRNIDDAHYVINETLSNRRINLNSKEAEALRDIITEYFNRK